MVVSVIYSNKFTCCDYYMTESFLIHPKRVTVSNLDSLEAGLWEVDLLSAMYGGKGENARESSYKVEEQCVYKSALRYDGASPAEISLDWITLL